MLSERNQSPRLHIAWLHRCEASGTAESVETAGGSWGIGEADAIWARGTSFWGEMFKNWTAVVVAKLCEYTKTHQIVCSLGKLYGI